MGNRGVEDGLYATKLATLLKTVDNSEQSWQVACIANSIDDGVGTFF